MTQLRLRQLAAHVCHGAARPAATAEAARPAATAEQPIFRHVDVDVDAWERDGFMAFPGILTDDACREALASMQSLQAKNDAIVRSTDWNGIDWSEFGLPPLTQPVTREQRESLCGGCELSMTPPGSLFPPSWGADARARGAGQRFAEQPGLPLAPGADFATHGFLPASFPLAYDGFALSLACHPQMLALHAKLIGCAQEKLRFDHSLLMNRPEARDAARDRAGWGGGGRKWHSHPYHQDGFGVTTKYTGLGLVRTLIYPEGSSIAQGGQVRGTACSLQCSAVQCTAVQCSAASICLQPIALRHRRQSRRATSGHCCSGRRRCCYCCGLTDIAASASLECQFRSWLSFLATISTAILSNGTPHGLMMTRR
jgi:hypothetical protein